MNQTAGADQPYQDNQIVNELVLAKCLMICYNALRRAKRGVGGALYLQSAAAGSNPHPEASACEAGADKER